MDLSVVMPNRNSTFTSKTIQDLLDKSEKEIEIIVNVDENWPDPLITDKRVTYIHPPSPVGLRQGINDCVALARGKYILKTDDHCMFGQGYDRILIENHQHAGWVQIPRRYALDAENWKIEERKDNKYPIDYMYIDFPRKGKEHDDGMHGVPWKRDRKEELDETPSMQGSCYFMLKQHFTDFLHGLSEEGYGQFAQESQEIGFKTWLGGGKMIVNKKTWYAHLHKGNRYGRMYQMPPGLVEASNWSADYWLNDRWEGRIHDFEWFIDVKFPDMPKWPKNWKDEIRKMEWIK